MVCAKSLEPRSGLCGQIDLAAIPASQLGGSLAADADALFSVNPANATALATLPQLIAETSLAVDKYDDTTLTLGADIVSTSHCDNTVIFSYFLDNIGSVNKECSTATAGVAYTHTQAIAAATWTVAHNLGRRPNSVIVYVGNVEVEAGIIHVSNNVSDICFASPQSGVAIFT